MTHGAFLGTPMAGNIIGAVGMELLKPDEDDRLKEREAQLRIEREGSAGELCIDAREAPSKRLDASQPRDRAVQKLCPVAASKSYSESDLCSAQDQGGGMDNDLASYGKDLGIAPRPGAQPTSQPPAPPQVATPANTTMPTPANAAMQPSAPAPAPKRPSIPALDALSRDAREAE